MSEIKHVTCEICGVHCVEHTHPLKIQPNSSSAHEPQWWHNPKYWFPDPLDGNETLPDLFAIIAEARRMAIEECKEKIAHCNGGACHNGLKCL